MRVKCPVCKKPVENTHEDFPFCSDRCRLVDLGKWASGEYVISSPLRDISDDAPRPSPSDRHDEE
ncbi:MAG: DNA gyrase inhibitor YacG [Acidobacteria bacterium]|nr:DNA gyrase inhibitor YacG [Acidobacteriota bacterium]MBV9622364.1 DNA gyrase inhibitor YacG [Acidobacteriota bacterium]